jgi:hypothetical protein
MLNNKIYKENAESIFGKSENMDNIISCILSSINKYSSRIAIVNQEMELTYAMLGEYITSYSTKINSLYRGSIKQINSYIYEF